MKKICMIVQDPMVKGGIAAVVNGYRGSKLEKDYKIIYVESYKDGGKITKLFKGICGYFHFVKVLFFDKPELIHIHSSFGPSFYRKIPFIYLASWANKPIINHIHGADFNKFYIDANDKKKNQIKRVYGKCSKLIALSIEWKEKLEQIVDESKIEIIENYSVVHEEALDERLSRECNNIILFLGEIGYRKGCYDIPDIAEKVVKEVKDVRFFICGVGSTEDQSAIKRLFVEKGLDSNVVFPGWVRNKKKDSILRKADIFFLPSYNEGMPMSILDAMGYGLPIISTNIGGIPKIVHNGENGMCCNPGETDELAAGIIKLLKNKDYRNRCAEKSMSIVKKDYSFEVHLSHLEELYERI